MTFSELVLEVRLRVHDTRQLDGTFITSATDDGIRWSSAQIQSISKGALAEIQRTFDGFNKKDLLTNHLNIGAFTRVDSLQFTGTAGDFAEAVAPVGSYRILRIQETDDVLKTNIYLPIKPEEFFSKVWLAVNEETQERGFTEVFEEGDSLRHVYIVPNPGDTLTVETSIIYRISPSSLYNTGSAVQLPFIDIDDLILDYAEKQARQIEHNPQQVQVIQDQINTKWLEMGIEIQRNKG